MCTKASFGASVEKSFPSWIVLTFNNICGNNNPGYGALFHAPAMDRGGEGSDTFLRFSATRSGQHTTSVLLRVARRQCHGESTRRVHGATARTLAEESVGARRSLPRCGLSRLTVYGVRFL